MEETDLDVVRDIYAAMAARDLTRLVVLIDEAGVIGGAPLDDPGPQGRRRPLRHRHAGDAARP